MKNSCLVPPESDLLPEPNDNFLMARKRRQRSFARAACLCVLALLWTLPARAQFEATVQGTITDDKGGVVQGASVTLTDQATQISKNTMTSADGFYRFVELAPGRYTVTVEANGFRKNVTGDVDVSAELARGLDIKLIVGQVNQSVIVNAANLADLQTEDANISGTLTAQEIVRLPAFSRDPYELLRFSPGIFGDGARNGAGLMTGFPNGAGAGGSAGPGGSNTAIFQTENQFPISANGQRPTSNDYLVDGVSVNSLQWGGAAVVTPSVESVQEMTVLANDYDASDGRSSGAHIKAVTKAGTNAYHGTGFFQYQDPGLNAFNKYNGFNFGADAPDPPVRDDNAYRQFGGNLGGAVIKNKLFFFFNYEGLRDNNSTFQDQWVDTPQFRQLVASFSPNTPVAATLADPGAAPRVAQVLPSSCTDTMGNDQFPEPCQQVGNAVNIGSPTGTYGTYLPNALVPNGGGLSMVPEFEFAEIILPATTSGNQYNGRVDVNMGRSVISVNTFFTQYHQLAADASAQGRPMADYNSNRFTPSGFLGWVFNINSTTVNEARFNFTRWAFNDVTANPQINWAIPRTEVQSALPQSQKFVYGAAQGDTSPGIFAQNTFAFRDVLSKLVGQHALRFGFEFSRYQDNDAELGAARPDIVFQQPWNLANGTAIFESVNVDPTTGGPANLHRAYRTSNYGVFGQDDWKIRSNLTVNLGLRWDYFAPPTDANGELINYSIPKDPINGLVDLSVFSPHKMYKSDYHNFAPRLGFAWSPDRFHAKAVLRGGFGIAFDSFDNNSFDISRNDPPLVVNYGLCCGGPGTPPPTVNSQILYQLGSDPRSPTSFVNHALAGGINPGNNLPIILPGGSGATIYGTPQNFPNPYIYLYSLEVQYALPKQWVAIAGYQGSSSHGLLRLQNNQYYFQAANPSVSAPFYFIPGANANFNALNTEVKRNFRNGLLVDFLYTYSKSIDIVSAEGPGFVTNPTFPADLRTERGPSDYDATHNLRVFALWDLPIFRDRHDLLGNTLGGWEWNGDFQFHSGFPWTPVASNNCFTLGVQFLCPVRPTAYLGNALRNASTDAFVPPNVGNFPAGGTNTFTTDAPVPSFPGIGRNSFRGPRFSQFDFTFVKNFGLPQMKLIGDTGKIQLRLNMFNVFNKLNLTPFVFGSTSTLITTSNNAGVPQPNPQFGFASSGLAGRTLSLEGRFVF
jgi:Carboxypeptidase regulatory-like domain/TonB dependent receptor